MKYSAVLVAATAGIATAQSISDIPACAQPCILDAVSTTTTCSQTDYQCQCTADNQQKITGGATLCVIEKCGQDVAIGQVLPATQAFCAAVLAGGSGSGSSSSGGAGSTAPTSTGPQPTIQTQTSTSVSVSVTQAPSTTTSRPTGSNSTSTIGGSGGSSTVPTAAAAIATGLGSFAMLALGALAAF